MFVWELHLKFSTWNLNAETYLY